MINFLPNKEDDFTFSSLFQNYEEGFTDLTDFGIYPFYRFRYFYLDKINLPKLILGINEKNIERFDMFKNIFTRGDYFYLIAYQYFINVKNYDFNYKVEGTMKIENGKTISFFEPLYEALIKEKKSSQIQLRHEYILSKNKSLYINKLTELLINDYNNLDNAIRRETNHFSKYGIVIKEVYLSIFKDFYSNYIDYLSNDNFERLKSLVYPSKKEVQSFKFAKRKNYQNLNDKEAKDRIIESIWIKLIEHKFISDDTTIEQIFALFDNKRRELQPIIWLSNITALSTFYRIMEVEKIIQDTENQHWKILADYFILKNGSEISREELKTKKQSTNTLLKTNLKDVFSFLDKIVTTKPTP